jgi:hypothetical protein
VLYLLLGNNEVTLEVLSWLDFSYYRFHNLSIVTRFGNASFGDLLAFTAAKKI